MYRLEKKIGDINMLPEEKALAIALDKKGDYKNLVRVLNCYYERPNGEGYPRYGFVLRKADACGIPEVSSKVHKWVNKGQGIGLCTYHVGSRYSFREEDLTSPRHYSPTWEELFEENKIPYK